MKRLDDFNSLVDRTRMIEHYGVILCLGVDMYDKRLEGNSTTVVWTRNGLN